MSLLRRAAIAAGTLLAAMTLVAVPAAAAPSEIDTAWMVAAHDNNLAEIAAGTAAQEQGTTEEVRELGAMFVEMHTDLDADLTAAAEQMGVELPDAPSAEQQAALDAVTAQEGADFDTAWIAHQIAAHQVAKAAGAVEIAEGSDPTVIQLAQDAAPVIQLHLDELLAAADAHGVPITVPSGTGGQLAESSALVGGGLVAAGALAVATSLVLVTRRRAQV